jgi:hypothetical protein
MSTYKRTFEEWVEVIRGEVMFVNVKPNSHNIISIALKVISERYGNKAANKVIVDLDLERLGWSQATL